MSKSLSRRIARLTLVAAIVLSLLASGSLAMAATYSGEDLAENLEFAANHDGGFYVSSDPIQVDGAVVQSRAPIAVEATGTLGYVDSGVVFTPDITLDKLDRIILKGNFGNTKGSILNIWIDASAVPDGRIFTYNEEGQMTGLNGDAYGCAQITPSNGLLIADKDTKFEMMTGGGYPSLEQLKAQYGSRKFSLWIGVSDSAAETRGLTLDKIIINQPDQVCVNPTWADPSKVPTELIPGVDAFSTIHEALAAAAPGATIQVAAGTYNENLAITKPVELIGETGAVIQLQGYGYASSVDVKTSGQVRIKNLAIIGTYEAESSQNSNYGSNCIYIEGNSVDVAVEGCSIAVGGGAPASSGNKYEFGHGILSNTGIQGAISVTGCDFSAVDKPKDVSVDSTRSARKAVHINPGIDTFSFTQNVINSGFTTEGVTSQAHTSSITGNVINGGIGTAICLNGSNTHAVQSASVTRNTITGARTAFWLRSAEGVNISNNVVSGCDCGVLAEKYSSTDYRADSITVENMNLSGCLVAVMNDGDDDTIDAANNYWGTDGPDTHYIGNVQVYPYYSDADLTDLIEPFEGIAVDDDWAAMDTGTNLVVNGSWLTIGTNAFASLADAVKAANSGDIISVFPGNYGLTSDVSWTAEGQPGWYLPITQDNLTIQGVDKNGVKFASKPTLDAPNALPLVYGADYTANGAWAKQDLVAVFGANVTITGLHFMPKSEPNKTVELIGANPTVRYCLFTPTTMVDVANVGDNDGDSDKEGVDYGNYGGSLYINGDRLDTGISDALIADNYFQQTSVAFDSVQYHGASDTVVANQVVGNTFDGLPSYVDNKTSATTSGYMIGNVTWANPAVTVFTGAVVKDNTFINYPSTDGTSIIRNRMDGRFTLEGNRMGGKDGASLMTIDTARYGCQNGSIQINSWINSAGHKVDSDILVDALGIHRHAVDPVDEPEPPVTPPVIPPVVAGSTSEAITTDGGTIQNGDNLAVTFPSGALNDDVTVTVAPVVENVPPTEGMIAIGNHVYEITAETDAGDSVTQFSTDITISFTLTTEELAQAEADGATPMVFYWDEELGAWIPVPTDLDGTTLVAHTNHLTTYAVMCKKGMPALTDIKGNWAEKHILKLVGLGVIGGQPDGTFAPNDGLTREQVAKMLALALGLTPDTNATLTFADANAVSDWATGYVSAVVKAGYMAGLPGNVFDPQGKVTRAQFAVMVARALGDKATAGSATTTFADDQQIPSWAKAEVAKAVAAGIIAGQPGNVFAPDQVCTRAESAKMLSLLISMVR